MGKKSNEWGQPNEVLRGWFFVKVGWFCLGKLLRARTPALQGKGNAAAPTSDAGVKCA